MARYKPRKKNHHLKPSARPIPTIYFPQAATTRPPWHWLVAVILALVLCVLGFSIGKAAYEAPEGIRNSMKLIEGW